MSTTTLHNEKNKTLVPQLRFQEFDGEWELKKLGEIAKIITGSTPSTTIDEYYDGEKLFVSPADIQENRYVYTTKTTLTESGFNKGRKIKKGSVLFVCIGSTIGKVAQTTVECLTNQQINALEANKEFQNDFIYNLLENNGAKIKMLAGVQAVPQINKTDFSNFKYSIPSLPEQQKIASFLSAVDEKIQQLTRKATLLEHYKKGVMQQLFSGKLRFKDENGKDYPDWEDTFFADTGKILIGLTHTPEYQPTGRPFLSSKNISRAYIDYNNIQYISEEKFQSMPESTKPRKGDILFTRVGSNLGNPKVIEEDIEFGIFVSLGVFRVNEKAYNYFMRIWMDSDYFWRQLEQKVAGGAKYNLNTGWLKEFKLNLPSFPEQQKIANFLSGIDSKIESVNQQLAQTQTFKKGLLQQMFV